MRVRMKLSISGTRNGTDWPLAGQTMVVSAEEAVDLLNAGLAEPVVTEPETATVTPAANAAAPKPRTSRAAKAAKAAKK